MGFKVCPRCGKLLSKSYYFGGYRCGRCGWRKDRSTMEKKTVYVSKRQWEEFLGGHRKTLEFFDERELHHQFGDYPEEDTVKVEIAEIDT